VISEKWFSVFSLKLASATNFYQEPGKNNRTDKTDGTKAANGDKGSSGGGQKGECQYRIYMEILL
jgi:hypothetical protein